VLGDGTSAAPAIAEPPKGDIWTQEEELALVKALKEIPKDLSDRWEMVAAAVVTKSKAACARRFKEMKDSYKAKKSNAQ
jgi:DnaJ family protein C protein 2